MGLLFAGRLGTRLIAFDLARFLAGGCGLSRFSFARLVLFRAFGFLVALLALGRGVLVILQLMLVTILQQYRLRTANPGLDAEARPFNVTGAAKI